MQDQAQTPLLFTYNHNQSKQTHYQKQCTPPQYSGFYLQPNPVQYRTTAIDIAPASFGVRTWRTRSGDMSNTVQGENDTDNPSPDNPSPFPLSWAKFKEFNKLQLIKIVDVMILMVSTFSSFVCWSIAVYMLVKNAHPAYAKITREILLFSQDPTFVLHQR